MGDSSMLAAKDKIEDWRHRGDSFGQRFGNYSNNIIWSGDPDSPGAYFSISYYRIETIYVKKDFWQLAPGSGVRTFSLDEINKERERV